MKLIIDIPDKVYEGVKALIAKNFGGRFSGKGLVHDSLRAIKNGVPLDSNSERAEVQAYFDGQAYGWEQGRKALIDDVKAEIEKDTREYVCDEFVDGLNHALEIIDKHISAEKDNTWERTTETMKK